MNDHRVGALLENRYRVLRRIARGGTAAVYEGLDERLDRPVALKIMHPHFADDPRFVTRAEREAKAAARLLAPTRPSDRWSGRWLRDLSLFAPAAAFDAPQQVQVAPLVV